MKCPNCQDVHLLMSERQGIEIDYCPQCRGVWLDRGELDKFIERSDMHAQSVSRVTDLPNRKPERVAPPFQTHAHPYDNRSDTQEPRRDDYDERSSSYRGKKKESFWGELFDFD